MSEEREVLAAEGTTPHQHTWALLYRPAGGQHCVRLLVNGSEHDAAWGFGIPELTEIGFAGGLTPGHGQFILFGLVTSRIQVVRAESYEAPRWSEVMTAALPGAKASDGTALRTFVLIRPPIEDVSALVGLDRAGEVVQRIPFPGRGRL